MEKIEKIIKEYFPHKDYGCEHCREEREIEEDKLRKVLIENINGKN